jgi:uncharacterized protein with PQ loop repeat
MIGNILLGVVSLCTFISYSPQIIKLIKTKKSEDLSVSSWILWVVSSFSYTLYAFLCSNDFMLIFETSLEFFFCLLTLILALKYKSKP